METLTNLAQALPFVEKGGVLLLPIYLASVVALALFAERLAALRRPLVLPPDFLIEARDLIERGKAPEAVTLCKKSGAPIAKIVAAGLKYVGEGRAVVRASIEDVGRREAAALERGLGVLGVVAAVSPLLGLLGTVAGMIRVFDSISHVGVGNPEALAGGIGQALITTAAGLTVAIPTFIAHRYLVSRADALVLEMEEFALDLVDPLSKQEREEGNPDVV